MKQHSKVKFSCFCCRKGSKKLEKQIMRRESRRERKQIIRKAIQHENPVER